MTQTIRHKPSRAYADDVLSALRQKMPADRAAKTFLRYYRAAKRTWGGELNAADFADQILYLDEVFTHPRVTGKRARLVTNAKQARVIAGKKGSKRPSANKPIAK